MKQVVGPTQDGWARWILQSRFGGDQAQADRVLALLGPIRDRVLAGAAIRGGDIVVDVGCGDGLLGFAALDLVGEQGRVTFCDVSVDLLDVCTQLADRTGAAARVDTVCTGLPDLTGLPDAAAGAVVIRSVLIYVADKDQALRNLRRVLVPGGRLSLFEPINSFAFPEPPDRLWGFDVTGLESIAAKVKAHYTSLTGGQDDPMLGFDERDLLRAAEDAGFTDIAVDVQTRVVHRHPAAGTPAATFLASSPNPLVPSFGEQLKAALTASEQQTMTALIERDLLQGKGQQRQSVAYLHATT